MRLNRTAKSFSALALLCALVGAGYGYWQARRSRAEMAHTPPLRVLCAENWLSEERLRRFSERNQVQVQYFTYAKTSEFLRQLANADGKVDVICTDSSLLRSLIRNHWLKRLNYPEFSNAKAIAVDFLHLPYDRKAEFGVPLFWNLKVFFGHSDKAVNSKQILQSHKAVVWGNELNLLDLLINNGLKLNEHQEEDEDKGLQKDVSAFIKNVVAVWPPEQTPKSADELLGKAEWAEMPLSRVAQFVNADYHFVLPDDGAAFSTGLLAVGEKSLQPRLAQLLINDLLSSDHAREVHRRLGAGVVHKTLDNDESIPSWQRPRALRQVPLNRLRFPDLNIEALPRFERAYSGHSESRPAAITKSPSDSEE